MGHTERNCFWHFKICLIDKIATNLSRKILHEPIDIANKFNALCNVISQKISSSIKQITKQSEDYIHSDFVIPSLDLEEMRPQNITDVLSKCHPNLALKLFKALEYEIATPLGKLFIISLITGVFPSKLKRS